MKKLIKNSERKESNLFSRSKQRLWTKGETSGHFQHVESIHIDCDQDTILIKVMPQGPTCHTGSLSCFNTEIASRFKIQALAQTIHQSAKANQSNSYTQYLLKEGIEKISKKFGEEAFEVVIGAIKHNQKKLLMKQQMSCITFCVTT